jgi:hypothetical protein
MAQNNNILQELQQMGSSLPVVPVPYQVPAGYFDMLADQVLMRIKAMDTQNAGEETSLLSPVVSGISKDMPYSVPAGYFETLDERIMSLVRESADYQTAGEELEHLSPLLSNLKKEMPFTVPAGYFENKVTIPDKAAPAKVVSFASRKLFRYAVAAVAIGIMAVTGVILINRNSNPEKVAAVIEAKAEKAIEKTSDKELIDFIEYTDAGQDLAVNDPGKEVTDLLKDVPATELQQFLDEIADPEN